MKLQQLRFLAAVVQNGLNITAAAKRLHTSQPGVSKQIRLLETELGFDIFEREGRNLVRLTDGGREVVDQALRVLQEVQNLRRLAADRRDDRRGTLSIGTTHTQARYVLPPVVARFRERYPDVDLHLHQGTSEQIADLAAAERVDLAIATGSEALFPALALIPAYRWHRRVVVPQGHPLTGRRTLDLAALARWPLVTYVFSFTGRSSLPALFESAGLELRVALTARDADVIKTYVRLGLGVGIVASTAVDPREDADLVSIDASHLFPAHTTWVGFRRGAVLRNYTREFVRQFAPHCTSALVDAALAGADPASLLAGIDLPIY